MEAELEPWAYLHVRHNTGLTVGGITGGGSNRLVTDTQTDTHATHVSPFSESLYYTASLLQKTDISTVTAFFRKSENPLDFFQLR